MTKGSPKKARRSVGVSMIDIGSLRVDPTIQQRTALDPESVEAYAAALRQGTELPAVVAFEDPDPDQGCWLADGFHREAAARTAGVSELLCDLRRGSRRDALLFAVGANASHGLRRSDDTKRRSVLTLLTDPEWGAWSNRAIADAAKVAHSFVAKVRAESTGFESSGPRTGRDGRTIDTTGIVEANQARAEDTDAGSAIGNQDLEGWPDREPPAGPWTAQPLERGLHSGIEEAIRPPPATERQVEQCATQTWQIFLPSRGPYGAPCAITRLRETAEPPDAPPDLWDRALAYGVEQGWWRIDGAAVVGLIDPDAPETATATASTAVGPRVLDDGERELGGPRVPTCRVCGCTDDDCSQCIEASGRPCWWVGDPDGDELCSRCEIELRRGVLAGEVTGSDTDLDADDDTDPNDDEWLDAAPTEAERATLAARADEPVGELDQVLDPDADLKPVSQAPDYDGDEWSTPDHIIEAARKVLGEIDLDPASNAFAQRRIRAGTFYTKDDDGLAQDWKGRVWLNPPYSQPLCGLFTALAIDDYDAGNIDAAIVLVNNASETAWFQALLSRFPACFFRGRIPFLLEGKAGKAGPRQGQVAFYLGPDPALFARVFGELGTVVRPVSP